MNNEICYISTKKARKILGVTTNTFVNWSKTGKINTIKAPSGVRLYDYNDIQTIVGNDNVIKQKKKIAYCRVSSKKQMDDLGRQENFFRENYPDYELVTDTGSGINWKRKGLKTILEQSMLGNIQEVMVAHRDRLCRFGFELLEWILEKNQTKLVVLDRDTQQSTSQELTDDILSIIHVYSCREMGKRRYTGKKNTDIPE
jgi:predicted site-specific integrase-resolvase